MLRAKVFVAGKEELQPIPVLIHILRAFIKADDSLDLRPVIDAVEREPTIAAQVIVCAQSAAYHNSAKPAISVKDAIYRMGLRDARRVILALALREAYDFRKCRSFRLKRYMISTIRVAHIVSIIGQPIISLIEKSGGGESLAIDPPGWYSIGLLHSIGLLYMVEREPAGMEVLFTEAGNLVEAECRIMGFTHYDVGAALLAAWGLPRPYHTSLPYLDDAAYRGDLWPVAAAIDLARQLASAMTRGGEDQVGELVNDVAGEWAGRWGVTLPSPLSLSPAGSAAMEEAVSLMEAVL